MRCTWEMIKSISNMHPNRENLKKIIWDGTEFVDDLLISEAFNEYFISVPTKLAEDIPQTNIDPLSYIQWSNPSSLYLNPVCPFECQKVITNLKNSKEELNHLPVTLFKEYSFLFVHTVCDLVNASFQSGVFPEKLKVARVIPVYKRGDRENINNYRPISMLSFMSKIYEKLLYTRLIKFINNHNILYDLQFGFRTGTSTTDAISCLVEYLYEVINQKQYAINIFIDFSRAFDTVDRKILLRKLERYGVRGPALNLISDYFTNRKQYVQFNSCSSSVRPIDCGVVQGSVLGPLFFLLYINDLPKISKIFRTILFADDSTLSVKGSDLREVSNLCNVELVKLLDWTRSNRLCINISKTVFNVVSTRSTDCTIHIQLDSQDIVRQDRVKFLGIILDDKLKFNHHITEIASKISKSIGIMYKLKYYLPCTTLKTIYYSLIYSKLFYGNIVWGCTYANHLKPLVLLQKKAIRIVNKTSYLHHTNELFLSSSILKLTDVTKLNLAVFFFKNQNLPRFYSNHQYPTRAGSLPQSNFQRLTVTQQSVYFRAPPIWNSLPDQIKSAPSLFSFKKRTKLYLVSTYESNQ